LLGLFKLLRIPEQHDTPRSLCRLALYPGSRPGLTSWK
jgi:hypothetical protein